MVRRGISYGLKEPIVDRCFRVLSQIQVFDRVTFAEESPTTLALVFAGLIKVPFPNRRISSLNFLTPCSLS